MTNLINGINNQIFDVKTCSHHEKYANHGKANAYADNSCSHNRPYPSLPAPQSPITPLEKFQANQIGITESSTESTDVKLKMIEMAECSIVLSGCFCGGEVFDKALDTIKQKLLTNRKLIVRILTCDAQLTETNYSRIKLLAHLFPDQFYLVVSNPKINVFKNGHAFETEENHTKILVVDGHYFVIGGSGVADIYNQKEKAVEKKPQSFVDKLQGKGMRDMDSFGSGPIAPTSQMEFYRLLRKWHHLCPSSCYGNPPSEKVLPAEHQNYDIDAYFAHKETVRAEAAMFLSNSKQGENNRIKQVYHYLIGHAQRSIQIGNLNFCNEEIIQSLCWAKQYTNVNVQVITNGRQQDSATSAGLAIGAVNRQHAQPLLKAGGEVYEYNKEEFLYHKKVMVIDETHIVIGSYNISDKSAELDDECVLVINSTQLATKMTRVLAEDRQASVKLQETYKSSIFERFQASVIDTFLGRVMQ